MAKKIDSFLLGNEIRKLDINQLDNFLSPEQKEELLVSKVITWNGPETVNRALQRASTIPFSLAEQMPTYLKSLGDGSRKFEGLETGFAKFDELIGGLNRFVLLAGMSGVGKSTLAVQLAMGVAAIEKVPVIYYSFEMSQRDLLTMVVQNKSKTLFRNDIELRGNAHDLQEDKSKAIKAADKSLKDIADRFYIVDASQGRTPDLLDIKAQITNLQAKHKTQRILVVLDSIQDIVPIEQNQTQAEAQTAQRLVEIQQSTEATILAIAQKNKTGVNNGGGYASVMGSVAFIHKPTTVIELIGGQEALNLAKKDNKISENELRAIEESLKSDTKDPNIAYPIFLNIIKGRNSGYGGMALKYYGAYRYYEDGQEDKFDELYHAAKSVF